MSEHRSHKVKTDKFRSLKPEYRIGTKSQSATIALWAVTAFFLFTSKKIIAVPFGFLALIQTLKEDKRLLAGYDNYFVLYDENDDEYCDQIYFSEIQEWSCRIKDREVYLNILLKDGEKIRITKGCSKATYNYFRKKVQDKKTGQKG